MKRFFSTVIAFILAAQFAVVTHATGSKTVDLGIPQDVRIIGSDVEEPDKFNSFQVSFTNDGSAFKNSKGYEIKLDWRMRLDTVNDWYEVNEFTTLDKSENPLIGLFYIQPGSVNAFKTAQPELYETLAPALADFTLWSGEKGLCFDRDNFSMELQLRYRAEKEGADTVTGKWSNSAFFGLATINGETPSSLIGKPELTGIEYSFVSDNDLNIKFSADIPNSLSRYGQSLVGNMKLTAQIDFGKNGFWYEFFSKKISDEDFANSIGTDINLADAVKLDQFKDVNFPSSTSKIESPISVRIRCEWYSKNGEGFEELPSLITEWSELSVDVNGSSGIVKQTSEPEDDGRMPFGAIAAIISAAVVLAVCVTVLIKKRQKQPKK